MSAEFESNRRAVEAQMEKNINACLEALGMEYTANAMTEMDTLIYNAPLPPSAGPNYRRYGIMRASQNYQVDRRNKEVIVGNAANYAVYVELPGLTRRWAGRPFMQNAINDYQEDYQAVAEAILSRGFK